MEVLSFETESGKGDRTRKWSSLRSTMRKKNARMEQTGLSGHHKEIKFMEFNGIHSKSRLQLPLILISDF